MRVAIVAPSPVPFIIGGAENLWWGMLRELNRRAGVVAELIKLPSPERNLVELIGSYRTFARLDLSHFDLVISTKYPAWMVRHPNHMVYLQHKLRGLYDTCPGHLARAPDAAAVERLRLPPALEAALLQGRGGESLDAAEVADVLLAALARADTPPELLQFPGTFARAVVHLLDRIGMQPGHIRRYAAISRTVRDRAAHFPAGCAVEVCHHPTGLEGLAPTTLPADAGIFTASRLVGAKRIDLLIDAYGRSGAAMPLRIAGAGPEEKALRARAARYDGIQFLGRLTDAELAQAYARAAFVPFVPYQEDYGLITLEAMLCGRPVLTVSDSGGPTELIEDGVNGVIAAPDVQSLGAAIARLATDPAGVAAMGLRARERAAAIHWQAFGDWLLSGAAPAPAAPHVARPAKPRVVVVNTFPVEPVVSGGKLRLFGLYRHLAQAFDVRFVNLAETAMPRHARPLAPGVVEEVVPVTPRLREQARDLEHKLGVSAGDLAAAMHPDSVPQWLEALREQLRSAQLAVCAHPYGFPALQAAGEPRPHLYEAHNVEYDLKAGMYGRHAWAAQLVRHFERQCAEQARGVTACSEQDAERLRELYQLAGTPVAVLANGIEIAETPFVPVAERNTRGRSLGKERPLALLMGSAHGPNLEAALLVLAAAARSPALDFAIMGSVCGMLDAAALPGNVAMLGVVDAAEKSLWLGLADYGLNPVRAGSGTNLKLAEYTASGLLVLSTAFGARGSGLAAWEDFVPIEADDLAGALRAARALDPARHDALVRSARAKVAAGGDWRKIGERYAAFASGFLRT
ncbi:putative glycosyltransferase [Cupriavidus taiwanensis]|uniref:Glycosyltransferase n=1 Tax=Cupriavidus taiwanensis TaxID=164546 RepID=A0A976B276_9BURK|nr:glycosyltransferase [Cupriavidus taiwanensis]SOZ67328.1 putative glycosyltransferase [Cupriavidus taiwanensis]SOZ68554.1 putative glycosyltransferase [Cupriavidus taiwanensis]SOZ71586.1 putative glycosyltransferase [Cupriavidus taiwanensis]SPA09389.1 putative glycosyltransferase [Cupriavidus taiwanensis]